MPSLYYRIEAPGINILKTVTDQVVSGMLDEFGVKDAFTDSVYVMSSFMAASQYSDSNHVANLQGKNRCDIDVAYVMDKAQVPWPTETPYTSPAFGTSLNDRGHYTPVLIDRKAGVLIEHRTVACALKMNFRMTFSTFDQACNVFDAIRTKYNAGFNQSSFDLAFSYPISMGIMEYLVAVYKAKTDFKDKSFLDYVHAMQVALISADVRKSQITDPNADVELMVRCQQLRCLGEVVMEQQEPDVERVNDLPDTYSVSFTLQLQFGRPNVIAVHTPVSIDNTYLPPELFAAVTHTSHDSPLTAGINQDCLINEFMRRSYGDFGNSAAITRSPVYDDWLTSDAQYRFYGYRPVLVAHFTLDGPVTTIDLKDLGELSLHPITQRILKETGGSVLGYGGLFTLGIYADTLRLSGDLVTIDDDLVLTIRSNRPDKVYHLMLSEACDLSKLDKSWNTLLVKYRYFFPMTIERNLQTLINKRYFYVGYDNSLLGLIAKGFRDGSLKTIITAMIASGDVTNEIYGYTQNPSQFADFLAYTQSERHDYQVPTGTDPTSVMLQQYYLTQASPESRSLLVVFLEQCLINGSVTLDTLPQQYLEPNRTVFPYYAGQGGYYGFNTPLRVLNFALNVGNPAQ
jgi:hypothetical protein